ncbi:DegT/DnrJ/EryC1/StrS family aminotransferase [Rugamonas sp.]|uniref:DegT/DnrJ/EryC1/StrS family aminotransferase n=1 Tax=Rugamonas sp. TaxID=1926287 RepID=UPI0025FC39D2|nr:DegT/DnrJ/EryC1/StrS family aminotransferase [Rugamonas sp.]
MGNMHVSELNAGVGPLAAGAGAASAEPIDAFPRSRLPVAPVLSAASFWRHPVGGARVSSVLDAGPARFVTSGRVAISLALRQMGVGGGATVLVPAYHCASMVEPVIWSGARPVFYRVNADTSVNLDDVASKLDGTVRVLMATNYFGFPQALDTLRRFCDAHGLMLLEDCAHSFLGSYAGRPLGSYGDYAIASSMKFFPIYEGGCLVSAHHALDRVTLRSAGLAFETKVAFNSLEDSFEYGRLPLLGALVKLPLWLKDTLWRGIKARRQPGAPSLAPGSSDGGFGFDPAWMHKRSSLFARAVLRLVSLPRMGQLRRRHYGQLQAGLAGLPGCRPLFAHLPDQVYPWVFPLWCDEPERVFRQLKRAGVPVIRFGEYLWPGVDRTVCANSVELSRRVLQFPCHQELSAPELAWMIEQIQGALKAQKAGSS